jgi:hypothetical protein
MATESVASFTIVIVRGAVYLKTFAITDENSDPITLTSAQIDVEPNGAPNFSWTQANGKFTNASPGVYDLALTAADTTAFTWDSGTYRMSIVDNGGDENPCFIEGLIFSKDC